MRYKSSNRDRMDSDFILPITADHSLLTHVSRYVCSRDVWRPCFHSNALHNLVFTINITILNYCISLNINTKLYRVYLLQTEVRLEFVNSPFTLQVYEQQICRSLMTREWRRLDTTMSDTHRFGKLTVCLH